MYDISYIGDKLREYVDRKADQFVIYPFGVNGINAKKALEEYFGLKPCYIVDNKYAKYNSAIIGGDELRAVWQENMYIILTVENEDINKQIFQHLLEFIPLEKIINLREVQSTCVNYDGTGFMLKDFLPLAQTVSVEKGRDKKIKVRIVHAYPTAWNSLDTICQAFQEDSLFDVLLVTGDWQKEKVAEQAKNCGCRSIDWNEYRGDEDQPDILILCVPFNRMIPGLVEGRNYAKLVVVAYWLIVRYCGKEEFIRRIMESYGVYRPDYYLVDSLLYKELKQMGCFAGKIMEFGNAKFDGVYRMMQKKEYVGMWKKLEGKTIVLWTTTHGVYKEIVTNAVTFDLYAKAIFEYTKNNPDMGLIFRPSDELVNEMLNLGFWSKNELMQFKAYCQESPNIVFDDTDTYDMAFSLADGILTDAFCGIICTSLPTRKPICVAYRSKQDQSWHPELTDHYYSAYENKDIIHFFEMIKKRQDPMLELREKAIQKYVKHFDGKNGFRIKEFISRKYKELTHID